MAKELAVSVMVSDQWVCLCNVVKKNYLRVDMKSYLDQDVVASS